MPTITGIIADRWINAEKIYGILHILYAGVLFYLPQVTSPENFFVVMLLAMIFICQPLHWQILFLIHYWKDHHYDVVKDFPPIRVWEPLVSLLQCGLPI